MRIKKYQNLDYFNCLILLSIFSLSLGGICKADDTIPVFTKLSIPAGLVGNLPSYGNPVWGDFNGDGYPDVYISGHTKRPALYLNNKNETFTNVIGSSGIKLTGDRHGAAWGDYDNDGDLDLFLATGASRGQAVGNKTDELYRNEGNGVFTDVTTAAGVNNINGRGRSAHWVDIDKDGYLDLFVKNVATDNALYHNNGNGTFSDIASSAGIAQVPGELSAWSDYDQDGDMDFFSAGSQLWRNNGNATFTNVTSASGIISTNKRPARAAWGDYNNDGYPDLYLVRGYSDVEDSLNWNSSRIIFSDQEQGSSGGLDFLTDAPSVTFDVYLQERREPGMVFMGQIKSSPTAIPFTINESQASGTPVFIAGQDKGFYIWKDTSGWHIRWSANISTTYFYGVITAAQINSVTAVNFIRQNPSAATIANTLYRNNGDGTFTDVTQIARVGLTNNTLGAAWGDFDNDGDLDLYVVDAGSFMGKMANCLLRNNGNGTFTNVVNIAQVWSVTNGRGDGAAWEDFNNDGFLDLMVNNGLFLPIPPRTGNTNILVSGPHLLFKNNGNRNNWLKVTLIGTISNRNAIGTRVTIDVNGQRQFREQNTGSHFFSQGLGPIHFGLGETVAIVDSLTVQWPSGITQVLRDVPVNQNLIVQEAP